MIRKVLTCGVTCNLKSKTSPAAHHWTTAYKYVRSSPVLHFHQAPWTHQSLAPLPLPLPGSDASTPLRPPITALDTSSPPPAMAPWKI